MTTQKPICVRITPQSLPALLERLERETGIKKVYDEPTIFTTWSKPNVFVFDGLNVYWINLDGTGCPFDEKDENEFVRLVAEACPTEV